MTLIDNLFLNMIHVLMPLCLYLFYTAFKEIEDDRENELALIVAIFSTTYISLKYNVPLFKEIPMVIINIPLLISFYKKNNICIIFTSVTCIYYYYLFYNNYLIIILLEYLIYYILYLTLKNKSFNVFIIIFTIIKTFFLCTIHFIETPFIQDEFIQIIFTGFLLGILSWCAIYAMIKAEDLLKIHKLSKEIEHDKQIRTALFRITHEIKNPIAVCKGYLDMFDTKNKEHSKKYIPIMKEEIEKTLYLLEDFLAMNKLKINKEIIDINILLIDLIKRFDLYFKGKHIKTKIDLYDDEIYINGDYNRLTQVFVNIIKNSIEALKENPEIEIKSEPKKEKIYIYFKDNGKGIPKDIIEKIKEPFFTTKEKGSGLGVALSDEIIRAHGGSITYKSKENEYTIVTIILPIYNIEKS